MQDTLKFRRTFLLVAAIILGALATQAGAQCSHADYLTDQERGGARSSEARSGTGLCGHGSAWTSALEDAVCNPARTLNTVAAAATDLGAADRVEIKTLASPRETN